MLNPEYELHAPDFFIIEMESIICKWHRRGILNRDEADRARASILQAGIRLHSTSQLRDNAYDIAMLTRRSFYDCLYIALAQIMGSKVITEDRRLFKGLDGTDFQEYVTLLEDL